VIRACLREASRPLENRSCRVPLTPAGSRLASAPNGVEAKATLRVDDEALMRWAIRLKLRR
jgi:hypothetical protein